MQTAVFICGCGHSGTSLMANMFASHPDVFIPQYETEIFIKENLALERWEKLRTEFQISGKRYLAEKTPRHVLALNRIRVAEPKARFIVMVRDGRDVAASFIKRRGNAVDGARRWLAENQIIRAEENATDVRIVRYEDLIDDAEGVLRQVTDFVGIPFDSQMLRYHERERLWFGVPEIKKGTGEEGVQHRMLRNWQINQPLFDERGKWKALLSDEDKALFETDEAHNLLHHFKYI